MMSARSASARKMMEDSKSVRSKKSTWTLRPNPDKPPDPFALGYHGAGFGFHADISDPAPPVPTSTSYSKTALGDKRLNGVSTKSNGSSSQGAPSLKDDYRKSDPQLLDKRSGGGLRKGLAKTFGFSSRKDKGKADFELPERPASAATLRQRSSSQPNSHDEFNFGNRRPTRQTVGTTSHRFFQPQYPSSPTSPQDPIDRPVTVAGPVPGGLPMPGPPPKTKLPPVPSNPSPQIKRYAGAGRPSSRWNRLRRDPELWDPNGDVLIYFSPKAQKESPNLRLSSHVIDATRNLFLIKLLRDGLVQENVDAYSHAQKQSHTNHSHYNSTSSSSSFAGGQPTPPVSEADDGTVEDDVSYEMFLPPPSYTNRAELIRYQVTTRNVFAVLYRAPLVGTSLYQAISDVHIRLEQYHAQNEYHPHGEISPVDMVKNYIISRRLDDGRGNTETVLAILAWAESPGVCWSAGWREAFIHAAGMPRRKLETNPNWRYVAPMTRALLERSSLEMDLRVQAVEERLAQFSFEDMWSGSSSPAALGWGSSLGSPLAAAGRFRNFLISHYEQAYGSWPPPPQLPPNNGDMEGDAGSMWLTRSLMRSLQQDFGALYEYLVDREVIWDVSEARAGRKWMMVSRGNKAFEADTEGMPMTDILIGFDNRQQIPLPHLENPHPLLPESVPPLGGAFRSNRAGVQEPVRNQKRDRMVALAYTESTNIDTLESTYSPTSLVDAFTRFEREDHINNVDPQMARRGRWVLLYGILQILAPVGVDAPGLRYTDGVDYHLSAKTKTPSWSREPELFVDAAHTDSYCWQVSRRWQQQIQQQVEDNRMTALEMLPSPLPPQSPRRSDEGMIQESQATSVASVGSLVHHDQPDDNEQLPKNFVSFNMTRPLTP